MGPLQRTVVIDLGSNTFRLVLFEAVPGEWWKHADEVYDRVRIGEGQGATGRLGEEPMARALETLHVHAHYCRARGLDDVRPVATSAIREAANGPEFVERAAAVLGHAVRVLSREEEARYGYLAAINSTTLTDGAVLDLGGGSMQLVEVADRGARASESWPLGAVRVTEKFLADGDRASKKQLKAVRAHVRKKLDDVAWLGSVERLVALGGTVRNLATAAELAAGLPSFGVQGFILEPDALGALIEELAGRTATERADVNGVKPERADVILAGALVVHETLALSGAPGLEVIEAGLREGVFFEAFLAGDPPAFPDVRRASVSTLTHRYDSPSAHVAHVAELALGMWDALTAAGRLDGDAGARDVLWAAAMLHDVGTAVAYDDHHKHSRYLILSSGLPGWSPREVALIAQIARYHRKGSPALGEWSALAEPGDEGLVRSAAAVLRLAEDLDRGRDQAIRTASVRVGGRGERLELVAEGDPVLLRRATEQMNGLWEEAFDGPLAVAA
jgi:exopolyphosphatase / guanosine-5'-triphosphate,3'-diphosphate pyrophosphatase